MRQENLNVKFYNGQKRKVRLLLPEDYRSSGIKYPVLYLFDGQNVFNPKESYTGETWGVKEAMKKLLRDGSLAPMVVVAIDHAEEMRISEYSPFDFDMAGTPIQGEGVVFSQFLCAELIPWLEARYPLIAEPWGRALAGSSMGGLITAYSAFAHPGYFSAYGIFSLCSWLCKKEFKEFVDTHQPDTQSRFFIQVGTREGFDTETGLEDRKVSYGYCHATQDFLRTLRAKGVPDERVHFRRGKGEWHSELIWRKYMPEFLLWLQSE